MKRILLYYLISSLAYPALGLLVYVSILFSSLDAFGRGWVLIYGTIIGCALLFLISLFTAHKFVGSFWHAFPPLFLLFLAFMLYGTWKEIDQKYIPKHYEDTFAGEELYLEKGQKVNGMKSGKFKYYDQEQEKLRLTLTWERDAINGLAVYYYEDGQKEMEGVLFNPMGCLTHGWIRKGEWHFYKKNGSLRETRTYNDDGKIVASSLYRIVCKGNEADETDERLRFYILETMLPYTGQFTREEVVWDGIIERPNPITVQIVDGYLEGAFEEYSWDEDSIQYLSARGTFKSGYIEEEYCSYYPNGQTECQIRFDHGLRQGLARWWHENGVLQCEQQHEAGELDGKSVWWYDTGILKEETSYLRGKREGLCKEYDDLGRLLLETIYENGQWKKEKRYEYAADGSYSLTESRVDAGSVVSEYSSTGTLISRTANLEAQ